MKIAIGFEIYDTEETPVLIHLTAQERLNIIAMPPNKNVFVLAPTNMTRESVDKWTQDIITRIDPKSVYKKEKL